MTTQQNEDDICSQVSKILEALPLGVVPWSQCNSHSAFHFVIFQFLQGTKSQNLLELYSLE